MLDFSPISYINFTLNLYKKQVATALKNVNFSTIGIVFL